MSQGEFRRCEKKIKSRPLESNCRPSRDQQQGIMRANYLVPGRKTMRIDLFHLEPASASKSGRAHAGGDHSSRGQAPSLVWLQTASFEDITPGTVKQQVEKRFRDLIASNPNLSSVVVIAPSMGDAGGEIIAAELVRAQSAPRSLTTKPVRELIWLTDPATGIA
jgi:hypothetical protein